jgi:hypothetical protein
MVTLSNPNLASQAVVVTAKAVAGEIFAGIGVELQWAGTSCRGNCATRIDVHLEAAAGPAERPASLAYATLGLESGRHIHIYFDRVAAMVPKASVGTLLGHVLAHEIGHILEGAPRHSDSGVMKARWERRDLQSLLHQPLRFELVDEALIHAALAGDTAGLNE